jgi:hypothetical protein
MFEKMNKIQWITYNIIHNSYQLITFEEQREKTKEIGMGVVPFSDVTVYIVLV